MIKDIIGYCAGFVACIFLLPQLHKMIYTKQVDDISQASIIFGFSGSTLWIVYGIMDHDLPIVICDTFIDVIYIIMYYYYRKYKTIPTDNKIEDIVL